MEFVITLICGYFLGALPFAVWVARHHGVDIFKVGSGNPGATNVKRVLGSKAGNLVFGMDCLKGFLATAWPIWVWGGSVEHLAIVGLCGALLGHSFSIFIGFRGGKGVATTMGGLVALMPWVLIVGVLVWLGVFYSTRFVSLASLAFGVSLPASALCFRQSMGVSAFSMVLMLLIILRHRSNIVRLLKGTENRFERK